MAQSCSPSNELNVGERLRRVAEQAEDFCETVDIPIENLIVIGASAGGHKALREVLTGLSPDIPVAVVIMQHLAGRELRD